MRYRIPNILFSALLLIPLLVSAQKIELHIPFSGGSNYSLCLMRGTWQDTISSGTLSAQGKCTITLPGKYASYRGVAKLSVDDYRQTINMIINGEDIIRINEVPGSNREVSFESSPENNFINDVTTRQRHILEKYGFINAGLSIFGIHDLFYPQLQSERTVLENNYRDLQTEIAGSPLYAARLTEILNCLAGAGSALHTDPDSLFIEQRLFITRKLDFGDLYTSGFFQPVLELWYQTTSASDSLLLSDSRYMLNRISDIAIRRELTGSIIRLFSKFGKDSLMAELGTEYLTIPLNGQQAPALINNGNSFLPQNSLIVFYETGCGSCHKELEILKGKYKLLTDNGIRVISIAADTDKEVFVSTSSAFPWADKLCDYEGFDGHNFRNYGIVGTPTFVLTDKEGIVRGRYAQIKELLTN